MGDLIFNSFSLSGGKMTSKKKAKNKTNKELRQVNRWYIVFYLRVFAGPPNKILGHLVDISEEGIMVISDTPVEVDNLYDLRMRLPAQMGEGEDIAFSATSKWCEYDSNPDFYLTGFQIQDIMPSSKNRINNLIEKFGYS